MRRVGRYSDCPAFLERGHERPCIKVQASKPAAAALAILLLSACAGNPPPPSGDTYCERARHISATDAQIKVFADNWAVMESYADQILTHNAVYDAACIKEGK